MKLRIMERFQKNFGTQVFAAFTVLILLVSLSFAFLLGRFQYSAKISELENTGRLMAEMLAHQSRLGLYSGNRELVRAPAESLLWNRLVRDVALFDPDGTMVFNRRQGGAKETVESAGSGQPQEREIPRQMIRSSSSPFFIQEPDALVVWAPVMLGNIYMKHQEIGLSPPLKESRPLGYIRITLGKNALREELRGIIIRTVALGIVFWAIGALLAYFLVRQIQKPIRQLIRRVIRFGTDGTCGDFPVKTKNEIGALARAFQEMTVSLRGHIRREIDTAKELAHAKNLAQLGLMASKVTHEVGNLLNGMRLVLQVLKNEPLTSKTERLLELLGNEAERTGGFITNFLLFAKKPVLDMSKAPLDAVIREILALYEAEADQADINLILDWPEAIPPVTADHKAIANVLTNLVKNSLAAIGRDGTVTISGRIDEGSLVVIVEDTGPGIDPSDMERLFEPFFTTKGKEGTGLGLSIVQGIIQAHGGTIACESEPGNGARFIIRLPGR